MSGFALREPAWRRWARRAVSIPLVGAGALLALALLPVLLPGALLLDALRGRLVATRALLFGLAFLLCESGGLAAAAALWVLRGPWTGAPREAWLRANFRLQCVWARALFGAAQRLFHLRVRVEGDAAVAPGPVLVFARHASMVDTLLPAVFVSARHGLRLRYVMKRELLADPCLDVVGQRLPNVFVQRGAATPEAEIAAVGALARGLAADEGVLIYPEGSRFTPVRREHALERVASSGDDARLRRVRALRRVLPPRSGGPLALLEAAPDADVVFLAHVGLEALVSPRDALTGELVGREVALGFWRVPRARIPEARAPRLAWLDAEWARVDAWVASRGELAAAPAAEAS